jgi:EAL domain-containing protein (putative c-di-GMP-specific phosphodiesterase class I)
LLKVNPLCVESKTMELLEGPVPIESGEHILRARRTAALTRVTMGIAGVLLCLTKPELISHPALAALGFAIILLTSAVQFAAPRLSLLSVEESLAATAGVLIVGTGSQHVEVLELLWLVAVASGVLARGGRAHWLGRYVLLGALALPIIRMGHVDFDYGAFVVATLGLLLTSGRLTRELNLLLRQARMAADSAETLLLAGDIAARMADRDGHPLPERDGAKQSASTLTTEERASAATALARLVQGEGLTMVVQPIVDIRTGAVHAFEALARFGESAVNTTPLHWFALAEELGGRAALERACLREALTLLGHRPHGTFLTVNLSAPVLLEAETLQMLHEAGELQSDDLQGLVIEITEETLVNGDRELESVIEPLRARGAQLAVDDMGAGYSGLRQITTVRPSYLKLDRSLCAGIDSDPERAALVGALTGYAAQVGSHLIAEGIETTAELEVLRRLKVPLVQGFRLSRPGEPWPEADAAARDPEHAAGAQPVTPPDGVIDPSQWFDGDEEGVRAGRVDPSRPLSTV